MRLWACPGRVSLIYSGLGAWNLIRPSFRQFQSPCRADKILNRRCPLRYDAQVTFGVYSENASIHVTCTYIVCVVNGLTRLHRRQRLLSIAIATFSY